MDLRVSEKGPVRLLFKLAVRLSDRVTVVSRVMRERAELRDAELVTSGVDPLFFEISPRYDSRTILHIRSLEPVYDVQTVIRAAQKVIERLPGSRFIIAGTGSQEAFLKALSAELGAEKHVDFTGPVSNMEIAELMKRSSVYVSAATADGTSIALLEAMAAGMIPVVTDIPENRAFITHGADGYLFRPQDPADLADNIIEAMGMSLPEGVLSEKRNA
jgi:glycosyltransferase involved in cell wall biosynthesis